ncbi:MAG: type IV secretion system protein [Deltaproteobacteria bacterium]|nr:type IV secretion system protein [Deltaproteobacteria bacterium]
MFPIDIFNAFFNQGEHLAAATAPYAMHLLYLLLFVEIATISISWMFGSDDPPELLWRIIRLLFTSGFSYWWLTSTWALGLDVLGSFHMLGQQISNVRDLTPSQFFDVGWQIAKLLWDAPSSSRIVPDVALALGEIIMAIVIMIMFAIVSVVCMFFVAGGMLILGPGSIFVPFMVNRFTTTLSENYFVWLVRTGAGILGFFIVLSTCQQFAVQWSTALANVCGATLTTLPAPALGGAPTIVNATVCTQAIPTATLLTLFADVFVVAFIGVGIPFLMAAFAGQGVHMALEHWAAARYLGKSVAKPISAAVGALAHQIYRMTHSSNQQTTLNQRMQAGAAAAARTSPTAPLTPPPSSSPPAGGWNGRPSGPPLAPPPAGGSGSGGAALEYYPGRPGAQTRAEAVDITKLQKR